MAGRDWKEYNEKLIRIGELYISLDFLKNWDKELEKMNLKKRGRPYKFPESFILFLAFIHVTFLPYRQLEGFLRKLSEYVTFGPRNCVERWFRTVKERTKYFWNNFRSGDWRRVQRFLFFCLPSGIILPGLIPGLMLRLVM